MSRVTWGMRTVLLCGTAVALSGCVSPSWQDAAKNAVCSPPDRLTVVPLGHIVDPPADVSLHVQCVPPAPTN